MAEITTIKDDDNWYFTTDNHLPVHGYGRTIDESVQDYNRAVAEYKHSGIFKRSVVVNAGDYERWISNG